MKKIFAIGLAVFALASCEMDFYPSDSMSSEQLAKDPDSPIYTTDGIYTYFQDRIAYKGQDGGESGNYYVRHYFQLSELRGDNVTVSGVTEDPFVFPYGYTDINTEKNIYYTWWMAYKIIYAANSNLELIKPGTSDLHDHLIGENYFFRAIGHFHMVTLFAMPYAQGRDNMGVPLRLSTDTFTTTRASVGEVYDAIVDDLIKAKEFLAKGESERVVGNEKGYVTKDAATALLARVYLYMGENEKCIDECNELMEHPSASLSGYDFADYPTHTYDHPETIWCSHMEPSHEWAIDHGEASIASMYIKDGIGWGEHYWREELIDLFMRYPEDKRFKAYFRMIEAHDVITPNPKTGKDKITSEGSIKTLDEMYQLFPDTYVVSYPVKVDGPSYSYAQGAISIGATRNADGSINFYHLEKDPSGATEERLDGEQVPVYIQYDHVAKRKIENRDTIYYVENSDAHFLGAEVDGLKRVWVRPGPGHATRKEIEVKKGEHKGEWYLQSQSDADARFNALVSRNDNGGAYRRYYNTKFSYQNGLPMLTSPVFLRWGEVVLNRAEAEAKLGKTGEALADLNIIRTRAGIAPLNAGDLASNGYNGDNPTLQAVLDERRKELCFEGHRFFDVFRNKLPMDRRYAGYHPWEIIQPNDLRIALLISQDEINSGGIPQNPR